MPGAQINRVDAETLGKLRVQVSFVVTIDRAYQLIQLIEDGKEFALI